MATFLYAIGALYALIILQSVTLCLCAESIDCSKDTEFSNAVEFINRQSGGVDLLLFNLHGNAAPLSKEERISLLSFNNTDYALELKNLQVSLSYVDKSRADAASIEVEMTNPFPETLWIPRLFGPHGALRNDAFQVWCTDELVAAELDTARRSYIGPTEKASVPTFDDFISLEPGETLFETSELSRSYDMTECRSFRVGLKPASPLLVVGEKQKLLRLLEVLHPKHPQISLIRAYGPSDVALQADPLEFKLDSSLPRAVSDEILDEPAFMPAGDANVTETEKFESYYKTQLPRRVLNKLAVSDWLETKNTLITFEPGKCSSRKKRASMLAVMQLEDMLQVVMDQLEKRKKCGAIFQSFFSHKQPSDKSLNKVFAKTVQKFKKLSNNARHLHFVCHPRDESIKGDCNGIIAYIYNSAVYNEIHLCPKFFAAERAKTVYTFDSQPGTILHELTHFRHFLNTGDYGNGVTQCLSLAQTNASVARGNANNYEYYAEAMYIGLRGMV